MVRLFRCLIISVLLVVGCNSLSCYYCTTCGSSSNSWATVSNSTTSVYCTSYSYSSAAISYVNRGISSSCTAGSDGIGGTWYCCQTNYCNLVVSGSNVSRSNSFGLIFTLITAVYIFKKVQIN